MTPDPTRHLADTGRRVLGLARLLLAPSAHPRLPRAFASLLLDPTVALSDVCGEVLEHPRPARGAAGGGDLPYGTEFRPFPDPGRRHPPYLPHAEAADPGTASGPLTKTVVASWPASPAFPSPVSPSSARTHTATRVPRSMLPEEVASVPDSPGTPGSARPSRTSTGPGNVQGFSDQPSSARRADPGGAQYGSSPAQEIEPAQLPAREVRPPARWTEPSAVLNDAPPSEDLQVDARPASPAQPRRTRYALGPLDAPAPKSLADGTRLVSGSEKLAATQRANLEAPNPKEPPGAPPRDTRAADDTVSTNSRAAWSATPGARHPSGADDVSARTAPGSGEQRTHTFPKREPERTRRQDPRRADAQGGDETREMSEAPGPYPATGDVRLASGSEKLAATLRANLEAPDAEEYPAQRRVATVPTGRDAPAAEGAARKDPGAAWRAASDDASAWTDSGNPWPVPSLRGPGAGDARSHLTAEGGAPEPRPVPPGYGVVRDAEPGSAPPANRNDLGEIMERLADELELEFIRTYGSSGG